MSVSEIVTSLKLLIKRVMILRSSVRWHILALVVGISYCITNLQITHSHRKEPRPGGELSLEISSGLLRLTHTEVPAATWV